MTLPFSIWIAAYLLGSIPFGVLLARARNIDLRRHGSGNIGATNVARALGKTAGLLTLLGDALKGLVAVWLADRFLADPWQVAAAGLMAFLGHVFSVFLRFRGGKGVATGLGVFAYLMPGAALGAVGMFALALGCTRYVSVGSMIAAVSLPGFGLVLRVPSAYVVLAAVTGVMVIARHHQNIRRLWAGTEDKFALK